MHRSLSVMATLVASTALLAGCVPAGPPTLEQVNAEFAQIAEPDWTVEMPGLFGEPALLDDLVAVYAVDEEVGLRLQVHSIETGELLWEAPASPGGAWAAPLFEETNSASRAYPIPAIQPMLLTRGEGEDAQPVVIYFERDLVNAEDSIAPDDYLHVADARTGEDLDLTIPGYDPSSDAYYSLRYLAEPGEDEFEITQGTVIAITYSPGRICGDGPTVCFEESEGGYIELDVGALEVTVTPPAFPEDYIPEWGPGFARFSGDDTNVALIEDNAVVWERTSGDLFADDRTSPPSLVDFIRAGDLMLIQGYRSITQTPELGNQLDLDYTDARRIVAIDPLTGETAWMLEGADALCFAVAGFRAEVDTEVLPMCRASAGYYSFNYDEGVMLDEEPLAASIIGVNVSDGSIEWEIEHAGELSITMVSRQLDWTFAQGEEFTPVLLEAEGALVDLTTGESITSPENATFLCEAERAGVDLEFEGSIFGAGRNPIALEYPAGWFGYPCDAEGEDAEWSRGSVRVGGYGEGDRRIVLTEDGIAGFTLG